MTRLICLLISDHQEPQQYGNRKEHFSALSRLGFSVIMANAASHYLCSSECAHTDHPPTPRNTAVTYCESFRETWTNCQNLTVLLRAQCWYTRENTMKAPNIRLRSFNISTNDKFFPLSFTWAELWCTVLQWLNTLSFVPDLLLFLMLE